jgi:hypothetical protein
MPHRIHAWPSVAGINATALPFLILRWRYGSVWVWEMDSPWQTIGRGLHSFASQLNLIALYGIGGACRGCVARFKGVFRVWRVFSCVRHGSS